MAISKEKREKIKNKFGGLCAYSGTKLEEDWQVDHVIPVRNYTYALILNDHMDDESNLLPCQRLINHYKNSMDLKLFRTWYMAGLHERLKKLPKNPKTEKSKRRIEYMRTIAGYFDIYENNPFSGKFYFETL